MKNLKKILVVDDDQDTLTIVRFCLKHLKEVTIKTATSGQEALREIPLFLPDLILLDVMMPKMDGVATLKEIRSTLKVPIPVVFFTAKVMEEELSFYYSLGVLDVIVKPFDPLTFAEHIQEIWKKSLEGGQTPHDSLK